MEKRICLSSLVLVFGVLGLVFQGIGFVVPAWFTYDVTIDTTGISSGNTIGNIMDESLQRSHLEDKKITIRVSMGLWTTTACVEVEGSELFGESGRKCRTVTNEELRETIGASGSKTSKAAGLKLMDDVSGPLQGLVIVGAMASVIAVILAGVFVRSSAARYQGFSSAIAWTFGAVLIFAAVGLQGNQFKRFNDNIELLETLPEVSDTLQMKSFFPWAIVMSGTGALFNLVAAVLIAFLANAQDPNAPGVWHTFSNQAVCNVSHDCEINYSEPSRMKPSLPMQTSSNTSDKASLRDQMYM